MRRPARILLASAVVLMLGWELTAEWHARESWRLRDECPQAALAHGDWAMRGILRRELRRAEVLELALTHRDYARVSQHARHDGLASPALQTRVRLALDVAGHVSATGPGEADLAAMCQAEPLHCVGLRVGAAQWWVERRSDGEAARRALGLSLVECLQLGCPDADPRLLSSALGIAWSYRSARGAVHDWLARPVIGLDPRDARHWRVRAALDRDDLATAERELRSEDLSCAAPAQAIASALLNSSTALRQERYDTARDALDAARQQLARSEHRRGAGMVLPHAAYLALRQGQWQQAEADYARLAESDDLWQRRDGLAGLGHAQMHSNKFVEADAQYLSALAIDHRLGSNDPRFRSRVLSMRAQSAIQMRQPDRAAQILAEASQWAESGADLSGRVTTWLTAADVRHRLGRHADALDAIDAALALHWRAEPGDASPFLSTQYAQAIERVYALAQDAPLLRGRALNTLWGLLEAMRHRPMWESGGTVRAVSDASRSVDPDVMRRHLNPDSTVLSFGFAGEQTFVLRLDRDGLQLTALAMQRSTLEELAARWLSGLRQAQSGVAPDRLAALNTRLHAALIEPMYRQGLQRGERLIVLGTGALRTLPWSGLHDAHSNRFLIEDHELLNVDTLFWLLQPELDGQGEHVVIAAAQAPPGARAEAEWIAGQLAVPLTDAAQLERGQVLGLLGSARLIHFAGHGIADAGHPLSAYLQLGPRNSGAAGRFTVAQILRTRVSAGLVVLGSCETSYGAHSNDWTLPAQSDPANAFIRAGAAQVVSSVLPAHDRATAEFMRTFYLALRDGDAVSALARAQRAMASAYPPALWAGFRISGSLSGYSPSGRTE